MKRRVILTWSNFEREHRMAVGIYSNSYTKLQCEFIVLDLVIILCVCI